MLCPSGRSEKSGLTALAVCEREARGKGNTHTIII